jgi:hypothetical protein
MGKELMGVAFQASEIINGKLRQVVPLHLVTGSRRI